MSEEINQDKPISPIFDRQGGDLLPSTEAEAPTKFRAQLDSLRQSLPEVEESYEEFLNKGTEIINQFEIDDALFDDPAKSLIFTAIVQRMIRLSSAPVAESGSYKNYHAWLENQYLHNRLANLAFNFSSHFSEVSATVAKNKRSDNPESLKKTYDKYTDLELSAELKRSLGVIVAETKNRLNIDEDNEDPFEVRVLSIATDQIQTFGLHPEMPDYNNLPDDSAQRQKVLDEAGADRYAFSKWSRDLVKRWEDLAPLIGMKHANVHAWITHDLGDKPTLCMPMPVALKMLHPEMIDKSGYYTPEHLEQDKAVVRHEYVHTQGGLNQDGLAVFGMGLEELRAEHYSGTNSYLDVRSFYLDLSTIVGEDMLNFFDSRPKGGTAAEVYLKLAQLVGLSSMLEVLSLPPISYYNDAVKEVGDSKPLVTDVDYLGGYDGVLGTILIAKEERGNYSQAFRERITQRAQRLLEGDRTFLPVTLERRRKMGLKLITRLLEDEIVRLEPSLSSIQQ